MQEKSKIKYCEAKVFFRGYPFEVIKVFDIKHVQELHYHDYIQIWYVKKGECIHYLNGKEHKMTAGDIFILPPNIPHKIISPDAEKTGLIGCGFLESFISGGYEGDAEYLKPFMVEADEVMPFFTLSGGALKKTEGIFDEILFEHQRKEQYFELYIKANILKLLSVVAREYHKTSYVSNNKILKYKRTIAEIISYMKDHCMEKIYIQNVCEMAEMSPTCFSQVFKALTGRTFTEYLRFLKMEKAKEMLLNNPDGKTIGEIASEIGFDDQGYFNRVFKKEMGVTPNQLRKGYNLF